MQPEHVESILSLFTTAAAFPAVLREAAGALRHTTRSDRSVLLTQIQRVASLVLGTVDRHPAALRLHASLLAFAAVLSGEKPQPHLAFADVGLPHCCAALLEAAEQGSSQVGAEDLALATAYADAAVEAATNAKAVRRLAAVTIARRESPTPSAASRAESAGGGEAQEEQDPTREALLTRLRDVGLPAAVVAAARAHKDSKPILTAALSVAHAVLRCGTRAFFPQPLIRGLPVLIPLPHCVSPQSPTSAPSAIGTWSTWSRRPSVATLRGQTRTPSLLQPSWCPSST